MCNGAAKQDSAGVAPCNMVGFVKLFWTSVARQVSRKVEPLSTSATVATIAVVIKTRVSPCNTTWWNWSRSILLRYAAKANQKPEQQHFETSFNVPEQVSTFCVTRCNACWNLFCIAVAHMFQPKVSTCNSGFSKPIALISSLPSPSCQLELPNVYADRVGRRGIACKRSGSNPFALPHSVSWPRENWGKSRK